jgi:predicted DCC family thiol-disulfide oxidoreductase YuxK
MTNQSAEKIEVLYNAACPVCSFEIEHYAKISGRQNLAIAFTDLNDADSLQRWGLTADAAARRLHVLKNGELLDGIPAFIALWREMPQYRWLAKLVSLPGVFHSAVWVYDRVLAPLLYRWHLRRRASSPSS